MVPPPVFGICGCSGSGKTTLIVELATRLTARGLNVGVVKHDAHGISIDPAGKDTDRIFRAGADVLIRGPEEMLLRAHGRHAPALHDTLALMAPFYDLVLVEGFKTTPLARKVWLCREDSEAPPSEVTHIARTLGRDEDRAAIVERMIDEWLPDAWRAAPLFAGILIGGRSTRMGIPKHLIRHMPCPHADPAAALRANRDTWLERIAAIAAACVREPVLLGDGAVPERLRHLRRLPDVLDAEGPLRGMLAAMRWAPSASWVFLACDLPFLDECALRWLIGHRRPGAWAVLPRKAGSDKLEPLFAYYDWRIHPQLARCRRPCDLGELRQTTTPVIPQHLDPAWTDIDTPGHLERAYARATPA